MSLQVSIVHLVYQQRTCNRIGEFQVCLCREAAAGHTGQFSWRAGPSGTVLAQHGSAPSTQGGPARGPWGNTGMVRARLAGLSFGSPAPTQVGL